MIPILFARSDSNYKNFPICDIYDIDRDARTWEGGAPGIYHPPCRTWGQMRHMAKPRYDEKDLALWSLENVRRFGGVLEHPKNSSLFRLSSFAPPGLIDSFGGWILPINQSQFGHKADKATFLYIVGVLPASIPDFPLPLTYPTHIVGTPGRRKDGTRLKIGDYGYKPELPKVEREHTPVILCEWLIELIMTINERCCTCGIK